MEDLERNYKEAVDKKKKVKAMVIINPGNPTGQVFSREDIEKV
jgi:aspartate/methionine/tyrosine aminotransferase